MRTFAVVVPALLLGGLAIPAPEEADGESRFLRNVRQVTFEGRRAGEGYFGPGGDRFIFQSEREDGNPFFQIYLMDLKTGDTSRVSPGSGKTTCGWIHPDGRRALFASTHLDPDTRDKQREELARRERGEERRYSWDYDEHYDLFEADLDSGELRRLTTAPGYDAEGSWSPDGRWIVFSSNRAAYQQKLSGREAEIFELDKSYFADLYLMRSDGSGLRRLTTAAGYDGGPFFSPDGNRIVWRRFSEDGATAEIYTMRTDGTDERQLTRLGAMSWAPFFHPSGDYLVFATNRHGFNNFELYGVDADGRREPVRVTFTAGFDGLPAFSSDGRQLAWTSNRALSGQSQIFFADWDDGALRRALGLTDELTDAGIRPDDLRRHVEYLASAELGGRMTGTEGERLATQYAADFFADLGLAPAGDSSSYFQEFEFTSGVELGPENSLTAEGPDGEKAFVVDRDWRPVAFSATGTFEAAPIVFAGYGLVAPGRGDREGYDSFVHLDVEGKWVLVLRFLPEDVAPERRQQLRPYAHLRFKALSAKARGAAGLLVASGPRSQARNQLVPLEADGEGAGSFPVVTISDAVGERLLGRSLEELQASLDDGSPQMGFAVEGWSLNATIDLEARRGRGRNVIAALRSAHPERPAIVVGAHIDHLGRSGGISSLAKSDERDRIHFGADDNASGSAAVLEMARWLADRKARGLLQLERDLLFALWSGEEIGLIGSTYYVKAADRDGDESLDGEIAACLNLDMVGRLDDRLILQGVGSSSIWTREIEQRNVAVGLNIVTQADSYLPTDSTPFYMRQVPILTAFTDLHGEYHTPRDTPDLLNYEGAARVARLMGLIAGSLAADTAEPDYVEMERPRQEARGGMRAYLGTIPDYAQGDVKGVLLGGVMAGGPAEGAGLQAGDVIVELAGQTIENLYDYTHAIGALKVGQEVTVVVVRDGERLDLKVTPESRN